MSEVLLYTYILYFDHHALPPPLPPTSFLSHSPPPPPPSTHKTHKHILLILMETVDTATLQALVSQAHVQTHKHPHSPQTKAIESTSRNVVTCHILLCLRLTIIAAQELALSSCHYFNHPLIPMKSGVAELLTTGVCTAMY